MYMHDCKVPQSVRRLFFVKTNHRRGAFVENIHMENIRTGHVQRVLEIDTDVSISGGSLFLLMKNVLLVLMAFI